MQNKKRVLVTGANGFVGSHLVKVLVESGYKVITPDHAKGFDILKKKAVLRLPKSDVVIHLAAKVIPIESWRHPKIFMETNIIGTLNLLQYCELNKAKMIFTSSYMYGASKVLPTPEDQPVSVENPYAVSKLAAENLCSVYSKKGFFDTTILRLFNIYGPGQSNKLLISQMIPELINKGKITIFDGRPKRDYLFIDDLVDAYIAILKHQAIGTKIYNIGSGKNWSVEQIARMLVKISGKKILVYDRKIERVNEIMETMADIAKIKREIGWRPKTDMKKGLTKTYRWYLKAFNK